MLRKAFLFGLICGAILFLYSMGFAQTGSISGRVTDVFGDSIPNAFVEAIRYEGGHWFDSTDSNGNYRITDLPTGDYGVRASAKGYAREYYDNVIFSKEALHVQVTAGTETSGIDFSLNNGGSISGHVFQSDGITPIRGVSINIKPASEWSDDGFHSTTNSDGFYTIDNLAFGEYRVQARAENWVDEWYDNFYYFWAATKVKVIPPDTVTGIDFHLGKGGAISGFVYESDGSTPIQGVQLIAHSDLGFFEAPSMKDGSYILPHLPEANYTIQSEKQGYAHEWYNSKNNSEDVDLVTVTEGDTVTDINFTLDTAGVVIGHVYEGDGVTPISGIELAAAFATREWVGVFAWTDYDGSYIGWIGKGRYFVCTTSHGRGHKYVDEWYDDEYSEWNADTVYVDIPDTTFGIDFCLARTPGTIVGHIYNVNTATPLANANIYAFPMQDWLTGSGANSDSSGYYEIWGLAWGDYVVEVTRFGCTMADIQVTVSADETTYVDFGLECVLGISEQEQSIISSPAFALYQNHPNPFVSTTTIKFALPKKSQVRLNIYDMSGRLVRTLIDREINAGYHKVVWDSRDDNGKLLPKGVYFCNFVVQPAEEIKEFRTTKKLISFR